MQFFAKFLQRICKFFHKDLPIFHANLCKLLQDYSSFCKFFHKFLQDSWAPGPLFGGPWAQIIGRLHQFFSKNLYNMGPKLEKILQDEGILSPILLEFFVKWAPFLHKISED